MLHLKFTAYRTNTFNIYRIWLVWAPCYGRYFFCLWLDCSWGPSHMNGQLDLFFFSAVMTKHASSLMSMVLPWDEVTITSWVAAFTFENGAKPVGRVWWLFIRNSFFCSREKKHDTNYEYFVKPLFRYCCRRSAFEEWKVLTVFSSISWSTIFYLYVCPVISGFREDHHLLGIVPLP